MKLLQKSIAWLVVSLATLPVYAQMEGTLYSMNSLPQVVINNPAFVPRYKVTVGFASSFVLGYTNNGFSYNDLITKKNDSVKVDLSKFGNALTDKNYITQTTQVELFRLGIKIKALYITASVTGKAYNRSMLPKDFLSLVINGNTQFVGTTVTFSPQVESLSYIESALGASYKVMDKLTVGARFKYLKGISNVTTETSSISITVDETQITASADALANTSGIYAATQSGFDFNKSYSNYLKNNGVAFDIGANLKLTDKLSVAASIIDIGQISWTNDVYQYSLDKTKATYTFQGIDAQKLIKGNTDFTGGIGDTLKNRFKFKETQGSSYSTMLPSKIYLSGNYELIKNLNVAAVLYTETFRGRVNTGWTGSINKHFGSIASMSLSYTIAERSANNLGAGLSLNFSPFQFYLVGDNLLNAPISLISSQNLNNYINNTKTFSLRAGLNFVFGRDKGEVASTGGPKGKSGKKYNEYRKQNQRKAPPKKK